MVHYFNNRYVYFDSIIRAYAFVGFKYKSHAEYAMEDVQGLYWGEGFVLKLDRRYINPLIDTDDLLDMKIVLEQELGKTCCIRTENDTLLICISAHMHLFSLRTTTRLNRPSS